MNFSSGYLKVDSKGKYQYKQFCLIVIIESRKKINTRTFFNTFLKVISITIACAYQDSTDTETIAKNTKLNDKVLPEK